MNTQRPRTTDDGSRVLPFTQRTTGRPAGIKAVRAGYENPGNSGQARDLSRYEQRADEPDDFRRRILANFAVMALLIALVGIGIWLAATIANLRNIQDCVLMGRRDCAQLVEPQK